MDAHGKYKNQREFDPTTAHKHTSDWEKKHGNIPKSYYKEKIGYDVDKGKGKKHNYGREEIKQ